MQLEFKPLTVKQQVICLNDSHTYTVHIPTYISLPGETNIMPLYPVTFNSSSMYKIIAITMTDIITVGKFF